MAAVNSPKELAALLTKSAEGRSLFFADAVQGT